MVVNGHEALKPHWHFWLIAAFALIWNALGAMNFSAQLFQNIVANMPDTHQAIIIGRPIWATAGFAVSVFGGALGGLLMMLRKRQAIYFFMASFAGTVVTDIHTYAVANSGVIFGGAELFVMMWLPLFVAAILVAYARFANAKHWLR